MNDPSITNAVATTTTTTAAATTTATTTATTRVSTFANQQPLINENHLPIPAFSVGESVYGKAVNGRDFGTWWPATVKSIEYSNENNEWCYTIKFKQGNEGLETLIGHNLVTIDEDKEFTVNNIKDRLDVLVFDKTTKKYYKGEIIEGTEQSNTRKRKVTAIEVACEGTNNYDLNNILNSTGIQISKERKRNEFLRVEPFKIEYFLQDIYPIINLYKLSNIKLFAVCSHKFGLLIEITNALYPDGKNIGLLLLFSEFAMECSTGSDEDL
ncbi:hypothetical protein PPL_00058 [Heterostelium album PN500]|uniref:Uncharacterized protein n=1 Tax=Heterostelium pallidum (strain ATCC 26659 / Pp 5 / PN500) TaxID=670386 RepID=D3BVQ7_HETP5|nr:hypothetical protein PPL_00058 [Heterostelium album PN500]EFA74560.1 hypothetical protein PPL_00058 [Heterostelium album PN500]|eukprot:XP_020426694.1 hypothetical protein PPL_00058 [Heterostelium album PN500]